jgi:putative DNA primase/helicase
MIDLMPNLAMIELQRKNQWVCWCLETVKDKLTKVPYNPHNGYKASTTDPLTWSSYEEASAALQSQRTFDDRAFTGIGFVFNEDYTGIDFDHCVNADGSIEKWAKDRLDYLATYAELSPSGTGIHAFASGITPDSKGKRVVLKGKSDPKAAIEIYCKGRFFTITGKHLAGMPEVIEERQKQIATVYLEIAPPKVKKSTITLPPAALHDLTDDALLNKAMQARNGATFTDLWRGNTSGYGNDASAADLALCNLLAFWTGKNAARMDRLFRQSGLYREKWESNARSGETYGEGTIKKAIEDCREVYNPDKPANGNTSGSGGTHGNAPEGIDLSSFDPDDSGNGDAMFALYGNDFLWCGAIGWFTYCGTHWQLDDDGAEVKKKAVEALRKRRVAAVNAGKEAVVKCTKADQGRVYGCISRFQSLVSVNIETFDKNPDLLNCQNGVVDLRNGTITPHSYKQRFTYCLPVPYEPSDYSEWIEYQNEVVGGGQEVIDYLQMAAGYSLTGHTREEIMFYLQGPTRSGKGTWAETFMKLLPKPISTMIDFTSLTAKRENDASNFDLAGLKPTRMLFASESQRAQQLNPAKIKTITGGDEVRASYKHKDFFNYRPVFKVWCLSNWPVNGDPEDDALWGRLRVIKFPNSFLGREDKTKKTRLKEPEALKGILYWSVQGAIKWYALGASGLSTPKAIAETTQEQRNDLDYVKQWLDECCEDDDEGWVSHEEVTKSYLAWCDDNNVQFKKGKKGLTQSLNVKGYEGGKVKKVDGVSQRGVAGLYIRSK